MEPMTPEQVMRDEKKWRDYLDRQDVLQEMAEVEKAMSEYEKGETE